MNQHFDLDRTITDWLVEDGPQDVPARAVDAALAATRGTPRARPLPTLLLRLTGDPMETTLRRPLPMARLAFALLLTALLLALVAGSLIVGSRLVNDGRLNTVTAPIPQGAARRLRLLVRDRRRTTTTSTRSGPTAPSCAASRPAATWISAPASRTTADASLTTDRVSRL